MTKLILTALLTAALGSAAQAAPSADEQTAPAVSISYADLNLSTEAGRIALQDRIDGAVNRVCPAENSRQLERRQHEESCRQQAQISAERQLSTIYADHQASMRTAQLAR